MAPAEGPGDLFQPNAGKQRGMFGWGGEVREEGLIRGAVREALYSGYERAEPELPGAGVAAPRKDGGRPPAGDSQLSLFDAPAVRMAPPDLVALGQRVRHVETGRLPSGLNRAGTPAEAAHVVAALRKSAQEQFLAIVTDDAGNVLRVARLFTGFRDAASVDPGIVAGAIVSTPGAKQVWYAHNHPSGKPEQSRADLAITKRLVELLDGMGISQRGMLAVGEQGRWTHSEPHLPGGSDGGWAQPALARARRGGGVAVTERRLIGKPPQGPPISGQLEAITAAQTAGAGREGILLLDTRHRPVGWLPMSAADMAQLRSNDVDKAGPGARLLAAIDETNASAFIARVNGELGLPSNSRATQNLAGFANLAGLRLLDTVNEHSSHLALMGSMPTAGTFSANPFTYAARALARDVALNPGRNLAAGFSGGVAGATVSEDEVGSAGWWADIGRGAVAGVALSQLLRGARVLGKGSIVDRNLVRLGEWIETLPLIGRGPEGVRDVKREQRLMRQVLDRQVGEVGAFLRDHFSPSERGMMADLIERRGIVRDLNVIHRQAEALDDFVAYAGERLKGLGMLPEDLETGGYLHRYYSKHLGLDGGQRRQAKGQTLAGSYSIARGTDEAFGREWLSPGATRWLEEMEWAQGELSRVDKEIKAWQRKARRVDEMEDADLFLEQMDEAIERLEDERADLQGTLADIRKRELRELTGEQNGQIRSFFFTPEEVGRVDTGLAPILAQRDKPPAGSVDARAMPQAPGVKDLAPTDRAWQLRGVQGNEVALWRDWTKAERQAWGEIDDAGYRFVRGMAEVNHDLSLATMYDRVARNADWVSTEPKSTKRGREWVLVPDGKVNPKSPLKRYGALAGKYVRPDVWAAIRHYGRPPFGEGRVGQIYRGALNRWKMWHTVYNPVTHFNNSWSNVEMMLAGGYSPGDLARALDEIRQGEASSVWREARDNGLFGNDWASSLLVSTEQTTGQALKDLAEQLRAQPEIPDAALVTSLAMDLKHWWLSSKNAVRDAQGPWQTGLELARAAGGPAVKGLKFLKRPVDVAARAAQNLYRFEDNLFKLAAYQAERRAGKSATEAVNTAQGLFFDYQDLPEAVKWVRDVPIGSPFVSYTYMAIPAMVRNAVRHPEAVLALAAGYEALNYAGLATTSDGLSPGEYWAVDRAEETLSPPWDRGRTLWGARNTVHLPYLESYRLSLARAHALGNPFAGEAGAREVVPNPPAGLSAWGSSILGGNPLHALVDVAVNESWSGKPIYHKGAPSEEQLKAALAYVYQAWAPSNVATPGGYAQTRLLEGMANTAAEARRAGADPGLSGAVVDNANAVAEALGLQQLTGLDRAGNPIVTRDAALAAFGIKLRPFRPEQSLEIETARLRREKSETQAWLKRLMRESGEGRRTEAQVEAAEAQRDAANAPRDARAQELEDAWKMLRQHGRLPAGAR